MKKTEYTNATVVTEDDLDFTEESKIKAIEQTRYDFLSIKGVIENSGTTPGAESYPLKVYLTGSPANVVNVYGGVAYDSYQGRSRRIWVPNKPSDVPASLAEAQASQDNIDMPQENQAEDFTTGSRPPRTNIKTFTASDAQGTYYVSIRYKEGTYSPRVSPATGQVFHSKVYESYEFNVSAAPASSLGEEWIQLATLSWDGNELTIQSDDRPLASATVTGTEERVTQHQTRLHDNAIIRSSFSYNYLHPVVDNTNKRVTLENTAFASGDGILVNGTFLTSLASTSVDFSDNPASTYYYLYIDETGNFLRTDQLDVAEQYLLVCRVYYDQSTQTLLIAAPASIPESVSPSSYQVVQDRRRFGSVGPKSFNLMGGNWSLEQDKLFSEVINDQLSHQQGNHTNHIVHDGVPPSSSLQASAIGGGLVEVADIASGDYAWINGYRITGIIGGSTTLDFSTSADGDYYIYAQRWTFIGMDTTSRQYCSIRTSTTYPTAASQLQIAKVTVSGGSVTAIRDLRVFGGIGFSDFARMRNAYNKDLLPIPLQIMYGDGTLNAGDSVEIYLTDDWGNSSNPGKGGTSSGVALFRYTPPLVQIWVYNTVSGRWYPAEYILDASGAQGFVYSIDDNNKVLTLQNTTTFNYSYRWLAIGFPVVQVTYRYNQRLPWT